MQHIISVISVISNSNHCNINYCKYKKIYGRTTILSDRFWNNVDLRYQSRMC